MIKPVKIVATIGPATYEETKIYALAIAGVDVFRLNFSHATPESVAEMTKWIRNAEKKLKRPLAIMLDLPGPKIRISDMKPGVELVKGNTFTISKNIQMGDEKGCGLNHDSIIDDLQVGADVYIDEGSIKLHITNKTPNSIETVVIIGGELKPKKGFSAEGIALRKSGLTDRDKEGIRLALEHELDALAISFVQSVDDVLEVKKLLPQHHPLMLISKIETANGVENAEAILDESGGMMIARGDLGLAVPLSQVPHIQKKLISLCVHKSKPVITATQMLESMITKPVPTRAEVTDVANAILDYTDAVMLSAETAAGKYPLETVEMMSKVIIDAVPYIKPYEFLDRKTMSNATSDSVGIIADQVGAKLIIAFTQTGMTAKRIAQHRHHQPIIGVTPNAAIMHKLKFTWGVHPQEIVETRDFNNMLEQARKWAQTNVVMPLKEGDYYVVSAGIPFGESGTTNMILVQRV